MEDTHTPTQDIERIGGKQRGKRKARRESVPPLSRLISEVFVMRITYPPLKEPIRVVENDW